MSCRAGQSSFIFFMISGELKEDPSLLPIRQISNRGATHFRKKSPCAESFVMGTFPGNFGEAVDGVGDCLIFS